MSLLVRDADPADAPAVAHLCTQLGYPAESSEIPLRLAQIVADGNARTLVAVNGNTIAGVETVHLRFVLNHTAPMAQITLLVVDEATRGGGVGRVLVSAAEAWANERGCERIIVNTALHRDGAHAFYERLGYVHTGRRYGKDLQHHT